MVTMNTYSATYASALLAATHQSQLADTSKPKAVKGLSDEQMAEVEAFLEGLDNHDDVQDMFVGLAG